MAGDGDGATHLQVSKVTRAVVAVGRHRAAAAARHAHVAALPHAEPRVVQPASDGLVVVEATWIRDLEHRHPTLHKRHNHKEPHATVVTNITRYDTTTAATGATATCHHAELRVAAAHHPSDNHSRRGVGHALFHPLKTRRTATAEPSSRPCPARQAEASSQGSDARC